jgi:hypothetical protein
VDVKPSVPSPSSLVLHGATSTGKSAVMHALLSSLSTPHAIIKSQECITVRHLLESTIHTCQASLSKLAELDASFSATVVGSTRCESLAALTVQLQHCLEHQAKFILVFDNIDQQREAPATLFPALARLGEIVSWHRRDASLCNRANSLNLSDSMFNHRFYRQCGPGKPSTSAGHAPHTFSNVHKGRGH